MNAAQARRSIRLATEILPKIPKKKFDIEIYGENREGCGAVCCVAGWAALDEEFKKEGCDYPDVKFGGAPSFGVNGDGVCGASNFFGLSEETFSPGGYDIDPSPEDALKRVEVEIVEAGYGDWLKLAKKAKRAEAAKKAKRAEAAKKAGKK